MTVESSFTDPSSTGFAAAGATRPNGVSGDPVRAGPTDATAVDGGAREAVPRLRILSGPGAGRSHPLGAAETSLGRDAACAVVLVDAAVSRRHAVIRREGPAHVLIDRGSGNGTRVNGRKVARHRLRPGDEIGIGKAVLLFAAEGDAAGTSAATRPARGGRAWGWAAAALLAVGALAAGLLAVRASRQAAAREALRGERQRALALRHLAEAERFFGDGRTAEAREQLAMASEMGAERQAADLGARADAEVPLARAVEQARAALSRGDPRAARDTLESVPAGSLIAPAAAAVRRESERALEAAAQQAARGQSGASARESASNSPQGAPAAAKVKGEARRAALKAEGRGGPAVAPARAVGGDPFGPAGAAVLAAYRGGDVAGALTRARTAEDPRSRQLARDLADFAAAVREGKAQAQAGHPREAIASLEAAAALDRDIAEDAGAEAGAGGDDRGTPTAEVRRLLAALHLALGEALGRGLDDDLPGAAAHLRAAVAAGSDDGRAQAAMARVAARAKEAYLRAYVAKDSDPDGARRAFRIVLGALPASDETAQKARRWLDKLDAKGGEG